MVKGIVCFACDKQIIDKKLNFVNWKYGDLMFLQNQLMIQLLTRQYVKTATKFVPFLF